MTHRQRWIVAVLVAALLTLSAGGVGHSFAQSPSGTVNTGALHIRSGPGVQYGVVFSVYRGTALTLLGRTSNASWLKIALDNGVQGWVNDSYVATAYPVWSLPVDGSGGPAPTTGAIATVNTGALNVRSGPGAGYGVVTSVYRGTTFALLARSADSGWLKVQLSSGAQGWVSSSYVTTTVSIWSLPVEGGVYVPPVVTPVPTTPTYRTHVVQAGENLFRISLNYGVNMWEVARLNGIYDLRLIYVGQVLLIP
jgi:uncharacterized protein YgiM (DUF1202 family)